MISAQGCAVDGDRIIVRRCDGVTGRQKIGKIKTIGNDMPWSEAVGNLLAGSDGESADDPASATDQINRLIFRAFTEIDRKIGL